METTVRRYGILFQGADFRQVGLLLVVTSADGLFQAMGIASIMPFIAILADPSLAETSRLFVLVRQLLPESLESNLVWVTGLFALAVLVVSNALTLLDYWLSLRLFNEHRCRLSTRLLSLYLGKELLEFKHRRISDMSTTILVEVERVVIDTLMAGMGLLSDIIVIVSIIGLLLIVDPWATVISVFILACGYLLVHVFIVREVERLGRDHAVAETRMFASLTQALALFKEAKILGKRRCFVESFGRPAREVAQVTNRYEILTFLPAQLIEVLTFSLMVLGALYLAGRQDVDFNATGVIAFYAFAAYRLVPVLKSLLDSWEAIRYGAGVVDDLLVELEQSESEPAIEGGTGGRFPLREAIVLEEVEFRYPGTLNAVFDGLDAVIPANKLSCVVGPSGAGKSTLLDLLLGLIEPTTGRCLIDGVPLSPGIRRQWRKGIGYVPQQVQLLNGTLAQNIALGQEPIDCARVEIAARDAGIHRFVLEQLAGGYETLVGDGGHTLSGGERQRVGIARALYHDPDLLLLDEATNELDDRTEEEILHHLLRLPGKTIVFATHKRTVRERADYLIELSGHFS